MYQIGDHVVYGVQGVCTIVDIEDKQFGDTIISYYVLRPVYQEASTVFIPQKNEKLTAKMHSVISAAEMEEFLAHANEIREEWNSNEHERQDRFSEVLSSGDRAGWLDVLRALTKERKNRMRLKKRLGMSDERQMKEAEKLIFDEVAYVLDLTREDVPSMVSPKVIMED